VEAEGKECMIGKTDESGVRADSRGGRGTECARKQQCRRRAIYISMYDDTEYQPPKYCFY
jgi:hypothetical protein